MVRKRLATAVLVTGALHSGLASALGLGELTLSSALNQPFRAEIPLRDIGELDVEQIRIALADDTAFENAGVERSQFLSSLEFQVELQGGGNGRIIVTTANTVQEPYLDFIVEVRWPNGKMNREYTVLLDLPVFAKASPAPTVNVARSVAPSAPAVKAAVVQDPAPNREPGGSIGVANRTAPLVRDVDQQQRLPAAADPTEYRVQHHDTMWKIAENLRPSSYVTTQQTMLALLKKNPKAFVAGNVNRIKSGYILRIPSEAEVHEINHDQAVEEIRNQAREWRGEKVNRVAADKKATLSTASSNAVPARAPQLDATDKSGREAPAVEEQTVKFSVGSAGSDTAAGNEVEALRQKVREEQENLEKSVLENGAMQARVLEMEKQIRTLQNLITLKNTQLAALQTGLAKGDGDAAVALADSEAISQDDEQEAMAPLAENDGGALVAGSEPDAGPAANTPSAPEAESPIETNTTSSDTNLVATAQAWLSNGFVKIIGLGVAILALLILVLRRRDNEADSEADLAAFEASLASSDVADSDVFSAKRDNFDFDIGNTEATELSDVTGEDSEPSFNADDFDFDKPDTATDAPDDLGMDEGDITVSAVETESVQPQTGDIVAEADIYVAYGRYDQAASLLKTAIAQDPDNADLHFKLVDIYLDTRDRENFTTAFAGLHSLGDAAAIARVKESMSAIDGVSDWLDAEDEFDDLTVAGNSTAELVESELDFELDDDLDFELSDLDADKADSVSDDVASLELDEAGIDDLGVDFANTRAPEAAGVEQGDNEELSDDVASDSNSLDDSVRNAEADALASLDVDLADLDFDFEPNAAVSGLAGEAEKASFDFADFDDVDLSQGDAADADLAATAEDVGLDGKDDSALSDDDDFEFDFVALDEAEENEESTGNGAEPDTLPPSNSANGDTLSSLAVDSDLDLDLDLSSFDAENDDELLSFEGSDADLDLDLTDFDAPLSPTADLDLSTESRDTPAVAADDEFFVDAADAEFENGELASAETTNKANDGEGIAVEDLSFDEFDADEGEGEFDNLLDTESVATKLDLARAYVDMGDSDGAREMLEEVLVEGDIQQQNDAQALLDIIG
ncbi:FimV/HubP family polar landmark protein [Zhongshania sp.]|uniref:FimV/HubP family polar landmark protein n=1 Tax=Zhongshania sp. TaxID=1971902 RepID=UPI003562A267